MNQTIATTTTNSSPVLEDGPALHTRICFATAWIIIAVVGIIGNSLVIFVAIRFQKLNNVTNCFIVNLAITDIVFLVFCMPLLVVQYTSDHWTFNQIFCKLLNFTSFVSVLVTVLTLVTMTIDRYVYVVRPFENSTWRKPRTVLFISLIIWLTSCLFASPYLYHYAVITQGNHLQCALRDNDEFRRYFLIYTVTLYYFIPLTIIVISYTKLLYYVYSKENRLKPKTKQSTKKWSRKRRAVTKMVAIVTLAFALCWFPITFYIISRYIFDSDTKFFYYFKVIGNSCAYLNSAINPLLYAFLNRSFRTKCGSLFSEPSCSLFCADEEQRMSQSQRQTLPKLPSTSTQLDRFSYQSTKRSSAPSMQQKRPKKVIVVDRNQQVTVVGETEIQSQNDYSNIELDKNDDEKLFSRTAIESSMCVSNTKVLSNTCTTAL